jgi:hypothetical protein
MPFQKGNKVGRQFKPGQSGNPNGRPRESLTHLLRDALHSPSAIRGCGGKTNAEVIVEALIREASIGNIRAFQIIADRIEGKPPSSVDVNLEMQNHEYRRERLLHVAKELAEKHGISDQEALNGLIKANPKLSEWL